MLVLIQASFFPANPATSWIGRFVISLATSFCAKQALFQQHTSVDSFSIAQPAVMKESLFGKLIFPDQVCS
jgi:hypothetical protein